MSGNVKIVYYLSLTIVILLYFKVYNFVFINLKTWAIYWKKFFFYHRYTALNKVSNFFDFLEKSILEATESSKALWIDPKKMDWSLQNSYDLKGICHAQQA